MSGRTPILGLITDFGYRGGHYSAAMKAVILGISPDIPIVDVSHAVKPFNITEAAFILYYSLLTAPEHSVIVVVVDPGVGTDRPILVVETEGGVYIVGPDNGLFSLVPLYGIRKCYTVSTEKLDGFYKSPIGRSTTFHGRDIMAPTGALLYTGYTPASIGNPYPADKIIIERGIVPPEKIEAIQRGTILYTDRFGNLITNIPYDKWVEVAGDYNFFSVKYGKKKYDAVRVRNYSEIPEDGYTLGILKGSTIFLEISLPRGSAEEYIGLSSGDRFILECR